MDGAKHKHVNNNYCSNNTQSNGTTEGQRFMRAQHTLINLSTIAQHLFPSLSEHGIYRYGGWPRSLSLRQKTGYMAITIEQVKDLIKQEIAPINLKLKDLTQKYEELSKSVKFFSNMYDDLLKQSRTTNAKVDRHGTDISDEARRQSD